MHNFRYVGGRLFCEGVAVESLVRQYGSPLYVYSQSTIADHFQKLDRAMTGLDHLVCFAVKSNSNLAVLRTVADLGGGFDIVSSGELRRIIAAGGDPRKCVFAGVGKTEAEIEYALKQGKPESATQALARKTRESGCPPSSPSWRWATASRRTAGWARR